MNDNANRPSSSANSSFLPLSALVILVSMDQISKLIVERLIRKGDSIEVISGFFNLVHIQNSGAAFGFMDNVDSVWINRGFTVIALTAIFVIFFMYRSIPAGDKLSKIALTLIASGAVGNLIDRARIGSVTDFLLFYYDKYQWPAFNVADSCITIGVVFLVTALLIPKGAE